MYIALVLLATSPLQSLDDRLADVDLAWHAIQTGHRYPWHTTDPVAFAERRGELERSIASQPLPVARFELARWIATIGDGHTLVPLLPLSQDRFCDESPRRYLPLRFELFDNGLFVVGADRRFARFVGMKVRTLGGRPVSQALEIAQSALPRRTRGFAQEYAPEWLMSEDVLSGGGLLSGDGTLSVGIGHLSPQQVPLVACSRFDWLHSRTDGPVMRENWRFAPDPSADFRGDLMSMNKGVLHIFELRVPDRNKAGNYFRTLLRGPPNDGNLIIDLRNTIGGDGTMIEPLFEALADRFGADWAARTVVLQGRRTHSAGIMLLSALRKAGVASFGQATGDAPSHYGETQAVRLPSFGTMLLYASDFYDTDRPGDGRANILPDHRISFMAGDYFAGRDPTMVAARTHERTMR